MLAAPRTGTTRTGTTALWSAAWTVPPLGLLLVRSSEAGLLGPYTSVVMAALALLILLNRARLDAFYWRHVIGEDSAELFEMRRARLRLSLIHISEPTRPY